MLWVLIRSASPKSLQGALMITHNISFLWKNKKTIYPDTSYLELCKAFPLYNAENYCIKPKYSDTPTPYHTCSKS